jgi:hypothetical protein
MGNWEVQMGTVNWRKVGVYALVVIPVLGLGGIAAISAQQAPASQQSDPVADAARRAREQKKEAAKPKKVYTNEDFGGAGAAASRSAATPAGTPAAGSVAAVTTTPAGDAGNKDAGAGDSATGSKATGANKNDEASWRKRFREARGKLVSSEKELDILQREAQKAQVQYYTDPTKAMTEQYSRKDVTEKDTQIAAKKQEVAQLKQNLADMEDELRKSGGDIGWARE